MCVCACVLVRACVLLTQTAERKRNGLFTNVDWKQMLVKAKTGEKMFRKILRAQPRLSGPWPGRPIAAQHPLLFWAGEAMGLDGRWNVGVGSRCPGKVAESQSTHSKRKAKTFACSTGQWPKPVLIQLNLLSHSECKHYPSLSTCPGFGCRAVDFKWNAR